MKTSRHGRAALSDQVRRLIEQEMRPAIREDGGDIAFEALRGTTVHVQMGAACATCPSRSRTATHYVEKLIRQRVSPRLSVHVRFVKPYFA